MRMPKWMKTLAQTAMDCCEWQGLGEFDLRFTSEKERGRDNHIWIAPVLGEIVEQGPEDGTEVFPLFSVSAHDVASLLDGPGLALGMDEPGPVAIHCGPDMQNGGIELSFEGVYEKHHVVITFQFRPFSDAEPGVAYEGGGMRSK